MIHSFRIKNFKSIKDSGEVKLSRVNAFIGKNGAGKSNIISALRLFKNLTEGRELTELVKEVAPMEAEFFKWGDFSNRSDFSFQIETHSGKQFKYSFTIASDTNAFQVLYIANESLFEIDSNDPTESVIIFERNRDNIVISENTDESRTYSVDPNRTFLSIFKEAQNDIVATISSYAFLAENPFIESGLKAVDLNSVNFNKIDDIAAALFIKNPEGFTKAVNVLQKILENFSAPSIKQISNDNDRPSSKNAINRDGKFRNFYFVLWNSRHSAGNHTYHSLSGGERRIIHIIFSLFLAEPRSLFVVEEIESGIHFGLIRRLMDEFKTQAHNHKVQIMFTTHNPDVLSTLAAANEVVWVKTEKNNGTIAKNLADTSEYNQIKADIADDIKAVILSGMFD